MIYMEPHQLGWKPLKDSYMETLPSSLTEEHRELVRPPSLPVPLGLSLISAAFWADLHLHVPGGKKGQGIPCLPAGIWLPASFLTFFSLWWGCGGEIRFSVFFYLRAHSLFPLVGEFWHLRNTVYGGGNVTPAPFPNQHQCL